MQHAAAFDRFIGQTIGNYQVQSKLGEGGMGAVYLAQHPLIGKQVALKILHAEFSHNAEITERFLTEARAVNDIEHPNIVDILDYGILTEGNSRTVYFIMEYLGGRSLNKVLRNEAPLPPERALAIGLQIADALSASHKHNIVHRDLKPDNVMLIQRGRHPDFVKVLDFGIAKLTGDQPGSRRTRTGIVMGTPAYMSPEQCEGKPDNVDHRTDIYALGIMLFEMLTGQVPFKGEGFGEVIVQHLTTAPARPSQLTPKIPPHVEAVVLKALEKLPLLRYPNMDVFMQALADPVGFVERHGGIGSFLSTDLTGSPVGVGFPTPLPGQLTPLPGQIAPLYTPSPGSLSPVGGYYPSESKKKRGGLRWLVVALALIATVALGLGGYMFVIKKKADAKGEDPPVVATDQTDGPESGGPESGGPESGGPESGGPEKNPTGPAGTGPTDPQATGPGETTENDAGPDQTEEPPAVPEQVTIKVITNPKGASVYLGDDDKPHGPTPLTLKVDKGSEPLTLTIKRSHFKDATRTFTPETNQEFDLKLTRERRKRPSTDSGGKPIDKDIGLETPDWD